MSSAQIGVVCLFLFATAQGARDAYFGHVFQSVSFTLVATLAFGLAVTIFPLWSLLRRPGDLQRLLAARRALTLLNVTTAAAWLSFFYGLRHLEPAVVATLFNGVGPLVVLATAWLGTPTARVRLAGGEYVFYWGTAAALAALVVVVLSNRSGMASADPATQAGALGAVLFGGTMITVSYFYTRRFTDAGIGSDAVMAGRFPLTLALAAILEFGVGGGGPRPALASLPFLAVVTFGLIVVPSFLVQFGVSRTSALAANVFRSLGPVFVFTVQQLDGRLRFSGATLACILVFCACTIAASVVRGWREFRPPVSAE